MALRKICDQCDAVVGVDELKPFMQLHGSLSEQKEAKNGDVAFRYLTPYGRDRLIFCDITCMVGWITRQQSNLPYRVRPYKEGDKEGLVIHI